MLSVKDVKNMVPQIDERRIGFFFEEVLGSIAEGAAGAKQMAAEALKVLELEVAGESWGEVDAALKNPEEDGLVGVVPGPVFGPFSPPEIGKDAEPDPTPTGDPDFKEPSDETA